MWSPDQYERFADERSKPFFDLLGLVERHSQPPRRVVDLGCGTGGLTRVLHRELGAIETVGIDSSREMLAKAPRDAAASGLSFAHDDIATFAPNEGFDVVFSNAALHWLPDHPALLTRLSKYVAERGQLAVQVPANFHHTSHLVAHEVATEDPFRTALAGYQRTTHVLAPDAYARILASLGYVRQRVRLEVYAHLLQSTSDVVEWVKGTLLTDYRARMSPELYEEFLARYTELLLARLPAERPYLYTFDRILFWGARG